MKQGYGYRKWQKDFGRHVNEHENGIRILAPAPYKFKEEREKIVLQYEEPEDLIVVMGDHNRLRQVFVNILDNALKHTSAGGTIAISVRHDNEAAAVIIADTGEGIKPEDLPQVKTKFYKGDSTKRGSGIGLAVADEIVNRHGGSLEIESIYQEGTTVTIILPLAGKKAEAEISETER